MSGRGRNRVGRLQEGVAPVALHMLDQSPLAAASPPPFIPWTSASEITDAGLRIPIVEWKTYGAERDLNILPFEAS